MAGMLFILIVWVQLLYCISAITAKAVTITNTPQLQPFSKNETIDTLGFEKTAPNVFFTNARNVTTSESVSYSPSQRPGFNSSIAPFTEFIIYKVVDSNPPLEMDFHSFGPRLPNRQGLDTVTAALAAVLPIVLAKRGLLPITAGHYQYTQQFPNLDNVTFSVGDFRELSERKSITYYTLADTLKGLGEFFKQERAHEWREVSFELELPRKRGGYVGSGHLTRRPGRAPGPTTTTGVFETS